MKKTIKSILKNFTILLFVVMFVFGGALIFKNENQKQVFADTNANYDNQTKILNNGQIISTSLWEALKKFYNNNKTSEMPAIPTVAEGENVAEYLTINLFVDFPVSKLDLSNQNIDNIKNFGIFNWSSFDEIDLSNNQIEDIKEEFAQLQNLKKINLSYNNIYSFKYNQLNETCYKTKLEELNLSHNKIGVCDLKLFESADIDVSYNELVKEKITLPDLMTIKVKLLYNYIHNADTTNENIYFGIQGIKNDAKYERGQTVEYYGIDEIENIKIYSRKQLDENTIQETLVKTLAKNDEPYAFGLGYYKIEFDTDTKTEETQDIIVYIIPKKPTIKMFRDGKELSEIEYTFNTPTTIKFYGEENAQFAYKLNSGELVYANEIEIEKVGINVLKVYQIVDGYTSDAETLFIEYKQKTIKGWIFAIVGSAIFVVAFYFIIKYYPVLVTKHIGKKSVNKKNLD